MRTILAVTLAALGLVAQARLGLGPCPSVPKVDLTAVTLTDGRWYLNYADESQVFANGLAFQPKPDCFAANVTKSATGFNWSPYLVLPALKDCKLTVRCGNPVGTCNCYVYAKPYDIVYFDNAAQVGAIYQCWEIKSAYDTFVKNMKMENNIFINAIAWIISGIINDLHVTTVDVFSMAPTVTGDALTRLTAWANDLIDQADPAYKASSQALSFARRWGGYDNTATYAFKNLVLIPQTEKQCKWSTKP